MRGKIMAVQGSQGFNQNSDMVAAASRSDWAGGPRKAQEETVDSLGNGILSDSDNLPLLSDRDVDDLQNSRRGDSFRGERMSREEYEKAKEGLSRSDYYTLEYNSSDDEYVSEGSYRDDFFLTTTYTLSGQSGMLGTELSFG
jgi:hypothetical protein